MPDAVAARSNGHAHAQLCVVGASYREVSTDVRARLAALEKSDAAPSRALVSAGYADGVVMLETCSRVEWIVSTSKPQWTEDILKSTLLSRVPDAKLHAKAGHAGAHYLLRFAMGLDSVAEGEPAVARQLVLAFERAHKDGVADRALRLAWRTVQNLLGERRKRGVVQRGLGVQTLVIEELRARGVALDAPIGVLGLGEIGRAAHAALRDNGWARAEGHKRATMKDLLALAERAHAVVVCTGGPAAFVDLPKRDTSAIVVDIGVPEQVRAAPGWTRVTLEQLLERPRRLLDDDTRAWLVDQVGVFSDRLTKELAAPPPATALSVIDEERRVFLRETLPPLLDKLPADQAEELRKACTGFAHTLMERVRESTSREAVYAPVETAPAAVDPGAAIEAGTALEAGAAPATSAHATEAGTTPATTAHAALEAGAAPATTARPPDAGTAPPTTARALDVAAALRGES